MVYNIRQLKKYWDAMKTDYQEFKKLKIWYNGLGLNEVTKTIEELDTWFNERISILSLIIFTNMHGFREYFLKI